MNKEFLVILFFVFGFFGAVAQEEKSPIDSTEGEKIHVIYAELQRTINTSTGFDRYLEGNVQIIKDSSYFYCDTSRFNDEVLMAWGDVSMIKSDSLEVYSDSMIYQILEEVADIYGSVYIKNKGQILFSDYIHFDDKNDIAYYTDKAILRNKTVELKSKRGEFRTREDLAIFSEQVSVIDSSFALYADSLLYNTALNKAIFVGPTDIFMDSAYVYCEDGFYMLDDEYGEFRKNARYEGVEDTAVADEIKVNAKKNEVELIGNAVYQGKTTYAKGDYIRYNSKTGEVEVRDESGNAYVKDGDQVLRSSVIFYNKKTKKFRSEGRSRIQSDASVLEADDVQALDKKGLATGNVIFRDTLNGIQINSEFLEFDQGNSSYNKAYSSGEKAVLRSKLDGTDSLYISADTLFSFQQIINDSIVSYDLDSTEYTEIVHDTITSPGVDSLSEIEISYKIDTLTKYHVDSTRLVSYSSDTTDLLTAYHGVRIYNDQFQAVCDSLSYNTKDSILTLFRKPVMWSDTSQFLGDTIRMYYRNSTLDKVLLFPKSFITNSTDEIYFNQIKGKVTEAYFLEGHIDSMVVVGNAQVIYYIQDENNAYVGVNTTDCSAMTFHFGETLERIDFETEPTSKMYPMGKVDHKTIQLDGFTWQTDLRPNKESVVNGVMIEEILDEAKNEEKKIDKKVKKGIKEEKKEAIKKEKK